MNAKLGAHQTQSATPIFFSIFFFGNFFESFVVKHFEKVFEFLPSESIKVAESGIRSIEDLKYIRQLGYDAVLIGTSLMKSKSPGRALEKMIEGFI